jgi:hypothetical protein
MEEWILDSFFFYLGTSYWVVSSTLQPLYLRGRALGTNWIGGWVDSRVGLDNKEKYNFVTTPGLEIRPLNRPASNQSV